MATATKTTKAKKTRKPTGIDLAALLERAGACEDSRELCAGRTAKEAWETSERGDHLLWIAARVGVDRKLVVLAACKCVRLALVHVKRGEDRPRKCIEVTEAWVVGKATIEKVREACLAVWAAADAGATFAAATGAAYAATTAAYTYTYTVAYAGYAGFAAAYAADAGAAKKKTLGRCAGIVRDIINFSVIAAAATKYLKE